MCQICDCVQCELDWLEDIWSIFIKLVFKQLIVDENFYCEFVDCYGEYFIGVMGVELIQKLIENFDIDVEVELLWDVI